MSEAIFDTNIFACMVISHIYTLSPNTDKLIISNVCKKPLQIMFSNNIVWICARWNMCGWQLQCSKDYCMFTQIDFLLYASQI